MKTLFTMVFISIALVAGGINPPVAISDEIVPVINEVMSLNSSTIQDEDGEYADWIEIYNPGNTSVDLGGYGLSDDPAEPFKWIFPDIALYSGQHLLIFASDKDKRDVPEHWETVINRGDEWQYFIGTSEPLATWNTIGFDDSAWQSGISGFGFGDDDDETVIPETVSLYIRKTFTVEDISNITECMLHLDYDDAFVAYINGTEIARENIGGPGTSPSYDQEAENAREADIYAGKNPEIFEIENIKTLLFTGDNLLAIQVHNKVSSHPIMQDMTVIPFLTFGMFTPPTDPQGVPDVLSFSIPITNLHTNFKVRVDGESLLLTDPSGDLCDQVETGYIPDNMSRGRQPDGGMEWKYFSQPTPGESNNTPGQIFANPVQVSPPGGFYEKTVTVELSVNSPSAVIRYTLNGADPTEESDIYTEPISVDLTTVVRARAYGEGLLPGRITTQTFFLNYTSTLPVISLSKSTGVFSETEMPVHVEFYEPDGYLGFSIDAGVKVLGRASKTYPQAILGIFARGKYGCSEIEYQIFPDMPITEFKSFLLRNSGQDWSFTMFRDGFFQDLFKELGIDTMAYRPAVVYINGKYWGIHNIREKQNEEFLASHHDVDPDNVDLWESLSSQPGTAGLNVIEGDGDHFLKMWNYIDEHGLRDNDNLDYVKTLIDYDNYVDYMVGNIYIDNQDWLGNNMKYWRPRTPEGKIRWLPFDLDYAMGGYHLILLLRGSFRSYRRDITDRYCYNTLIFATHPEGPEPEYKAWSTFLFRKFLENESFTHDFCNRMSDYLNTNFRKERVLQRLNKVVATIEPEMPTHIERWGDTGMGGQRKAITSMDDWYVNIQFVENIIETRADSLDRYFTEFFNLSGTAEVELDLSQPGSGTVQLNTVIPENYPWNGTYFQDVPVKLTALPNPGYKFAGWTGITPADSSSVTVTLAGDVSVTANFEEDSDATNMVLINEINYNAAGDFDPEDWVELHSTYDIPIDISGWIFKDEDDTHTFVIPDNTVIEPHGYLVLCRDVAAFHEMFPEVEQYLGDFGFGLSSAGELLRLYNAQSAMVDSLTYGSAGSWPEEPNGTGAALALRNPNFDNTLPENWAISRAHGTPGEANEVVIPEIVVINEINYNAAGDFDPGDWVEFHNPSDDAVTLSGWRFVGENEADTVVFPENTVLNSGDYLVLCGDTAKFHAVFPDVEHYIGGLEFDLHAAGQIISLITVYGETADSLTYGAQSPWPEEPDGTGVTLALRNPGFDNARPENWAASADHGTPGKINDVIVTSSIVINEINYNSSKDFDPEDWVELYNPQDVPMDISGWIFRDEDDAHVFAIPENTIIGADDYLVLCRDASLFHDLFPQVNNYLGDFGFGLSGAGELLRLSSAQSAIIDSLTYNNVFPWPYEPDGFGSTLALINPDYDNSISENWAASEPHGTPGEINDVYVEDPGKATVFSLWQNYPNPFNKQTIIQYSIPEPCRVTIEIYSILGNRIDAMENNHTLAGQYTIIFKPKNISSGVYFYTVKAGEHEKSKRMLFVK